MPKTLKIKLDHQQKSNTSWLVTTIKQLVRKISKELRTVLLSLKRTQEAAVHNSNIMAAFNVNLDEALKAQQLIPLDYGSELRDPTGISYLFHHHEDRDIIMYIIQIGLQYHLSPI